MSKPLPEGCTGLVNCPIEEARLARVTAWADDESSVMGSSPDMREGYRYAQEDVLALIRAVAADELDDVDDDSSGGMSVCRDCGEQTPIDDQAAIDAHVEQHDADWRAGQTIDPWAQSWAP